MNYRNLQFLFKPRFWLLLNTFNADVDRIINELLDKYEFSDLDEQQLTCKLGKTTIWVGNIPYAAFSLYGTHLYEFRPSRLTIQRAMDKFLPFKEKVNLERMNSFRNTIL